MANQIFTDAVLYATKNIPTLSIAIRRLFNAIRYDRQRCCSRQGEGSRTFAQVEVSFRHSLLNRAEFVGNSKTRDEGAMTSKAANRFSPDVPPDGAVGASHEKTARRVGRWYRSRRRSAVQIPLGGSGGSAGRLGRTFCGCVLHVCRQKGGIVCVAFATDTQPQRIVGWLANWSACAGFVIAAVEQVKQVEPSLGSVGDGHDNVEAETIIGF